MNQLDNHICKHSVYEVIDPQHQVIARFETEPVAISFMTGLDVPYKEFYDVKEAEVYGGVHDD